MENNNNGNNFFTGFLWGAVIGGAAVFLLSTNKGKKLLKLISQEGLDNIVEILKQQEQVVDEEEHEVEQEVKASQNEKKEPNGEVGHAQEVSKKPLVKRFFKGILRKR